MTTLLNGLVGGLFVGLIAAVATENVSREPSMASILLDRMVGERARRSKAIVIGGRTVYATLAGGGFLAVELYVFQALSVPPSLSSALQVGVAWGLVLFLTWVFVLRVGLPSIADRAAVFELFAFHMLYGIGMALWVRLTWLT